MPIPQALEALSSLLGDRLSCSKPDLEAHGQSEAHFAPCPPDAVAYPETTQEVADLVRICAQQGCPVVGYGAGTSLEAQAIATQGGVVVDFAKMNRVLEVNPQDMDVRVQPGVTREQLNTELRATGLFFPVDPGANASLGGMAATRASGTTAVRYGTMRDNVMGTQTVLGTGEVIRTGTRARKSSAGYDLTALLVGSEGTLGLTTELTLRLHGQPEAISAAICGFDTIGNAVECVMATIQMGIPMARIEFLDQETVAAVNAQSALAMAEKPHLMVEFHGSDNGVIEQAERFGEIVTDFGGDGFKWSSRPEERSALWEARHRAYWSVLASRPGATGVVTDMCVPISRLSDAIEETRADIAASALRGPMVGHVGDGNFHALLLVEPGNTAEMDVAMQLAGRMAERALAMGGTVTGEHGVGLGKKKYMQSEHGSGWQAMGLIKHALDPHNIMNPGKLVAGN